jgi:hypothetical protein
MNQCAHNPECEQVVGITLQRQIDPAPVPYCLQHASEQEQAFRLSLQDFRRVVVVPLELSELEQTKARLAELEATSHELRDDGDAAELETALRTLEQQNNILEATRRDLAESREAFTVAQRELERTKRELERVKGDLAMATQALDLARNSGQAPPAPAAAVPPQTPPPATRPDPVKP